MSKWCGLLVLCLGFWLCPGLAKSADISEVHRLVKLGLTDSALAVADSAIGRDSTDLALRVVAANILRSQGDTAGCAVMLHAAMRLASRNLDERLALLEALWDSGLPDSARLLVGRGVGSHGQLGLRGHYLEGRFYELAGQPDSAIVAYRRVRDVLRRERLF